MAEGIEGVGQTLGGKVGPVKGYVWVLVIGAGAWGYYLWKKRSTSSQSVAVAPVVDPTLTESSGVGQLPGTNTGTGYTVAGQQGTSTPSNASWASMVGDALIGSGGNPTDVSNALSNYLGGQSLTSTQQAIVDNALRQYGSPPNGVLPVQTQPGFVGHVYTVQNGDTLSSILKQFYGSGATPVTQRIVVDNNPGVDHTLTPGMKIKLPTVGIGGVQSNTLNTYDAPLPSWVNPKDIPGGGYYVNGVWNAA